MTDCCLLRKFYSLPELSFVFDIELLQIKPFAIAEETCNFVTQLSKLVKVRPR